MSYYFLHKDSWIWIKPEKFDVISRKDIPIRSEDHSVDTTCEFCNDYPTYIGKIAFQEIKIKQIHKSVYCDFCQKYQESKTFYDLTKPFKNKYVRS